MEVRVNLQKSTQVKESQHMSILGVCKNRTGPEIRPESECFWFGLWVMEFLISGFQSDLVKTWKNPVLSDRPKTFIFIFFIENYDNIGNKTSVPSGPKIEPDWTGKDSNLF